MSELDFLEQPAPGEDQPAPPPADAPTESPTGGPARGADGKFMAKDTAQAPQAAPEPVQAQETGQAPEATIQTVPLPVHLDERDKRKALEAQLAAYREREREWLAANAEPPSPEASLEARAYAQNLSISRRFAEKEYGREEVKELHDWAFQKCEADPFFNELMRSSDDPYEAAMQARNREMIAAKVTPDRLAQFEAWEKAQAEAQNANGASTPPQPPAVPPPRSLATAPNAGGISATPQGAHVPYEALPFN